MRCSDRSSCAQPTKEPGEYDTPPECQVYYKRRNDAPVQLNVRTMRLQHVDLDGVDVSENRASQPCKPTDPH